MVTLGQLFLKAIKEIVRNVTAITMATMGSIIDRVISKNWATIVMATVLSTVMVTVLVYSLILVSAMISSIVYVTISSRRSTIDHERSLLPSRTVTETG
jgi:uncharacterized membrane protein